MCGELEKERCRAAVKEATVIEVVKEKLLRCMQMPSTHVRIDKPSGCRINVHHAGGLSK
jgi:hypothetical protein